MTTNNSSNYRPVQYDTLVGAANGGITSISTGSTGQVLTSNGASSDPSYQSISVTKVLISSQNASSSSSLVFTSGITGYSYYVLEFLNLLPQTDGARLYVRVSVNGGSSYKSTDYGVSNINSSANAATVSNYIATTTAYDMCGSSGLTNSNNAENLSGYLNLYGLGSRGYANVIGQSTYNLTSTTNLETVTINGQYIGYDGPVNALQVLFSSGNIFSGTVNLYGVSQSSITPLAGLFSINTQVFTYTGSTQTYTPTTNMQYAIVEVVGGGGGSGGVTASGAISGGGGGGGYSRKVLSSSTIGASQIINIGAGGTAGASGNNNGGTGGTTSFGTAPLLQATGGSGGGGGASPSSTFVGSSLGGIGSLGDINSTGGISAASFVTTAVGAANTASGGSSFYGSGGISVASATQTPGSLGTAYGAGAGGAVSLGTGTAQAGAAGTSGVCIVTEYIVS